SPHQVGSSTAPAPHHLGPVQSHQVGLTHGSGATPTPAHPGLSPVPPHGSGFTPPSHYGPLPAHGLGHGVGHGLGHVAAAGAKAGMPLIVKLIIVVVVFVGGGLGVYAAVTSNTSSTSIDANGIQRTPLYFVSRSAYLTSDGYRSAAACEVRVRGENGVSMT